MGMRNASPISMLKDAFKHGFEAAQIRVRRTIRH